MTTHTHTPASCSHKSSHLDSGPFGFDLLLLERQRSGVQTGVDGGFVFEKHESESTWISGGVRFDGDVLDGAELFHVGLQVVRRRFPRNPTNEDLPTVRLHFRGGFR